MNTWLYRGLLAVALALSLVPDVSALAHAQKSAPDPKQSEYRAKDLSWWF
jgi:hypothetical protein